MPLLTNPTDPKRIVRDLREWRQTLLNDLPPRAEPLFVPRNTRGRALIGQHQVRFQWDPGSPNLDGFDISWSEKPNFETSNSRRLHDPKALFLDVPVDTDAKFLYFRVRAFINQQISRWSPTTKVATEPARTATLVGVLAAPEYHVRVDIPGILTFDHIELAENSAANQVQELHILAPSVDETDLGLYGTITEAIAGVLADPVTVTVTVVNGSRKEDEFQEHDFILIDDNGINVGRYKYEAMQIAKINGNQWTFQRHGAQPYVNPDQGISETFDRFAQFGTRKVSHDAGRRFYKLQMRRFEFSVGPNGYAETPPSSPSGIPQILMPVDPSQCVVSTLMAAWTPTRGYGTWALRYLVPIPGDTKSLPAPGLRTKDGCQYTLGLAGDLVPSQTMQLWLPVSHWQTIRCVYGRVKKIGTDVKLYVLYVAPPDPGGASEAQRKVAMFPEMTIAVGKNHTYDPAAATGNPDGRNTPFLGTWPFNVLPVVGTVAILFDGDKQYIGAIPPVPTGDTVIYSPDGDLLALCGAVGIGTAPADCTIVVQT